MCLRRLFLLSGLSLFFLGIGTFPLGATVRAYSVAASQARYQIDINKLECISLHPSGAVIFKENFYLNPKIADIVRSVWPGKQVYLDDVQCPYVLDFTIISQITRAVRYRGEPSKVFMSFQVCGRKTNGRVDADLCSYKNLYLFDSRVKPLETFEIGLKAFLRMQSDEWVVVTIQSENLGEGR